MDDTQCCNEQKSHTSFTVHYAVRSTKNRWRYQTITLTHTDPRQVASWVKTLRNYLLGNFYDNYNNIYNTITYHFNIIKLVK